MKCGITMAGNSTMMSKINSSQATETTIDKSASVSSGTTEGESSEKQMFFNCTTSSSFTTCEHVKEITDYKNVIKRHSCSINSTSSVEQRKQSDKLSKEFKKEKVARKQQDTSNMLDPKPVRRYNSRGLQDMHNQYKYFYNPITKHKWLTTGMVLEQQLEQQQRKRKEREMEMRKLAKEQPTTNITIRQQRSMDKYNQRQMTKLYSSFTQQLPTIQVISESSPSLSGEMNDRSKSPTKMCIETTCISSSTDLTATGNTVEVENYNENDVFEFIKRMEARIAGTNGTISRPTSSTCDARFSRISCNDSTPRNCDNERSIVSNVEINNGKAGLTNRHEVVCTSKIYNISREIDEVTNEVLGDGIDRTDKDTNKINLSHVSDTGSTDEIVCTDANFEKMMMDSGDIVVHNVNDIAATFGQENDGLKALNDDTLRQCQKSCATYFNQGELNAKTTDARYEVQRIDQRGNDTKSSTSCQENGLEKEHYTNGNKAKQSSLKQARKKKTELLDSAQARELNIKRRRLEFLQFKEKQGQGNEEQNSKLKIVTNTLIVENQTKEQPKVETKNSSKRRKILWEHQSYELNKEKQKQRHSLKQNEEARQNEKRKVLLRQMAQRKLVAIKHQRLNDMKQKMLLDLEQNRLIELKQQRLVQLELQAEQEKFVKELKQQLYFEELENSRLLELQKMRYIQVGQLECDSLSALEELQQKKLVRHVQQRIQRQTVLSSLVHSTQTAQSLATVSPLLAFAPAAIKSTLDTSISSGRRSNVALTATLRNNNYSIENQAAVQSWLMARRNVRL